MSIKVLLTALGRNIRHSVVHLYQMEVQSANANGRRFESGRGGPETSLNLFGPETSLNLFGPETSLNLFGPETSLNLFGPETSLNLFGPP